MSDLKKHPAVIRLAEKMARKDGLTKLDAAIRYLEKRVDPPRPNGGESVALPAEDDKEGWAAFRAYFEGWNEGFGEAIRLLKMVQSGEIEV